jgi:hypothetical protein
VREWIAKSAVVGILRPLRVRSQENVDPGDVHGTPSRPLTVQSTQVDFVWLLRRIHSLCPS